VSVAAVCVLT